MRAVIERGPKGKKAVAFAVDWPGLSRGGRTAEQALETLDVYRGRYASIARAAGLETEYAEDGDVEVVEDRVGLASTDFWGISFAPCALETEPVPDAELDRRLALLQAAWTFLDDTAARVTPQLRKGARGGGRDRDEVVAHVLRTETYDFARRLGLRTPEDAVLDLATRGPFREEYVALMRTYNAGEGKRMRSWNLPFLLRHTTFHTLDHAWELEDKDLGVDSASTG